MSASRESIKSSTSLKKSEAHIDILPAIESQNLTSEVTAENPKRNSDEHVTDNPGRFTTAVEDIKKRRVEEILAKKKREEEEKERFVKESAERKAAERAEIIKQAKRLILYRKPMCRRINRALLVSECYRELDAQLKFQETFKNFDKEEETRYVKLMKEDAAKYEKEQKQVAEEQLEKQKRYAKELKEQIEENEKDTKEKESVEFEAAKQDQININKYLKDAKEHEEQELRNKKQKLKQFFKDAIEEKKQFDLKLKQEEEFEDRAIEAYQNAKERIKKMHKEVQLKRKKNIEHKIQAITEKHQMFVQSKEDVDEKILLRAVEEKEADYKEKEEIRKERESRMRRELQELRKETAVARLKQLQKVKDLKAWEMMQRFKKAEHDKNVELKQQGEEWNKKIEYGKALRRHISEKEAEQKQEKLLEEKATNVKVIIEKENQRVLDYAEEVINESKDVRPLYPILKAVEECKKEMGLVPLRRKEETVTETVLTRRRRRPRISTKFLPEEQICYLK
ncbi:uncharacterized protein LOC143175268 [Nomia melanderi]|uniref:uncharacterized protein LOC143175268 n=1 Tax=Nomia melanderi TaxID=2448451 RepID=UPI003FCC5A00